MHYVIYGDIHGCLEEWEELRKLVPRNSYEFCVGDLIDKGPYPVETIKYAQKNKIHSVLGNHEFKHLRKWWGRKVKLDENQKEIFPKLSNNEFEYISAMPYYIKLNNLLIVHAGVTNKLNLNRKKDLDKLLYLRDVDQNENFLPLNHNCQNPIFWADLYKGTNGFVVYGHTPFKKVKTNRHSVGIDTACVYGEKLTAVVIKDTFKPWEYEIVSVKAKSKYSELHFPIRED